MNSTLERLRSLNPIYAVVDQNGIIVSVSKAWRTSAKEHGLGKTAWVGASYFDHCPAKATGELANSLRLLLRRELPVVTYVYPCHTPTVQRWFLLVALPGGPRRGKATLVHIDITSMLARLPERYLRELIMDLVAAMPLRREDVVSAGLLSAIGDFLADGNAAAGRESGAHRRANNLTPMEGRVAALISRGNSNDEIATALGCALNTVKRHVTAILTKLRLKKRAQVAVWYQERHRNGPGTG